MGESRARDRVVPDLKHFEPVARGEVDGLGWLKS